jgi:regulator of replication initiation timing
MQKFEIGGHVLRYKGINDLQVKLEKEWESLQLRKNELMMEQKSLRLREKELARVLGRRALPSRRNAQPRNTKPPVRATEVNHVA